VRSASRRSGAVFPRHATPVGDRLSQWALRIFVWRATRRSFSNDGTYRWFDEKQYRLCGADETTTDHEVLANLIGQLSYHGPGVVPTPSRSGGLREAMDSFRERALERDRLHGPYWLRCMTPEIDGAEDEASAVPSLCTFLDVLRAEVADPDQTLWLGGSRPQGHGEREVLGGSGSPVSSP
jgi:hypothetical protein